MAELRYYSRSGHTKMVAEAIAESIGVKAVSVDEQGAGIDEPADVLFVGGAVYMYGIDKNLKRWLEELDARKVTRAALFSTSMASKRALSLMKKLLEKKGISVADKVFYAKGKPDAETLKKAKSFAQRIIKSDT